MFASNGDVFRPAGRRSRHRRKCSAVMLKTPGLVVHLTLSKEKEFMSTEGVPGWRSVGRKVSPEEFTPDEKLMLCVPLEVSPRLRPSRSKPQLEVP